MYGSDSWGRFPRVKQNIVALRSRTDLSWQNKKEPLLAYGQGRSYGDLCLNDGATVLTTANLDHLISFDRDIGIFRAEAGITLEEILKICVPAGWFLPVSPGTQFVSLGGAIANDIHGKNHHKAGTFGLHVRALELLRTDGERLVCSPDQNQELFNATIAGIGLTGIITWAEIQLISINNPYMSVENIQFNNLNEFFELTNSSSERFDYTVAWLDCVSSGSNLGRGIFMRGNHAGPEVKEVKKGMLPVDPVVPFDLPSFTLNSMTVKAFNTLYFHKQMKKFQALNCHYEPYFYPLDSVRNWNRIYGSNGFYQFQCVLASRKAKDYLRKVLDITVASGEASFLAVLKEFGSIRSPGMLSFPRPGYTLCLDFANRGKSTRELMSKLESVVIESDGALYPAKDACMLPSTFKKCYPLYNDFKKFKDPGLSSTFWRRVMEE